MSHHPLALAPLPQVNTLIVCVFLAETWWQRAEYPTWAGAWLYNGWWRSYNDKEPQAGKGYLKSQAVKDCLSLQMLFGILRFSQGCHGRLWSHHMCLWFGCRDSRIFVLYILQYFVWPTQEIGMKFIAFGFKAGLGKSHRRWPIHLLSAGLWWNVMIFATW